MLVLQSPGLPIPMAGADAGGGSEWLKTRGGWGNQVSISHTSLDAYFLIGWKDTSTPDSCQLTNSPATLIAAPYGLALCLHRLILNKT